jgi:hypothetical protein
MWARVILLPEIIIVDKWAKSQCFYPEIDDYAAMPLL